MQSWKPEDPADGKEQKTGRAVTQSSIPSKNSFQKLRQLFSYTQAEEFITSGLPLKNAQGRPPDRRKLPPGGNKDLRGMKSTGDLCVEESSKVGAAEGTQMRRKRRKTSVASF